MSCWQYVPDECPDRPHRSPAGPNEDFGQCGMCGDTSFEMRPEGETYGGHIDDCCLPPWHENLCQRGGAGHSLAPTIRGYWPGQFGDPTSEDLAGLAMAALALAAEAEG